MLTFVVMFKNTPTYKALTKVSLLNKDSVFVVVFNTPQVKNMVIEMNTRDQLYQKGVDSKGTPLEAIGGSYSDLTIQIKSEKGQRVDHVTLNDTGDFYRSWVVTVQAGRINITANTIKDVDDLQSRWGGDILGLTEESREKLTNYAVIKYREYILKQWTV